jgi:tetratricopeptide (TPR) repeat protein
VAPLSVEVAGCASVRAGPRCVLPADATLTFALPPGEAAPEFTPPGVAEPSRAGAAERHRVAVPAGTARVEVRRGSATFTLEVAPAAEAPTPAEARHKAGQVARREGRPDAALVELEAAATLADAAGEVSQAARSRMLGAFVAIEQRRFDAARRLMDAVPVQGALWPEGDALRLYHAALLARESGDLRAALRAFDEARAITDRLALPFGRVVAQETAAVWLRLGRATEAHARFEALAADFGEAAPCERADALLNAAWVVLFERARDRGAFPGRSVASTLETALRAYETTCHDTPTRPTNVRVNLALDALGTGDLDAARRHLSAAAKGPEDAEIAVWRRHAQGRLALAEGRTAEALSLAERLSREAESTAAAELAWRAAVDAGTALEALGRLDEAATWYRRAEAQLDDRATLVPVDEGRVRLLGDLGESARRLVGVELALKHPAAALEALRLARRRALSRLSRPDPTGLDPARRAAWAQAYADYAAARAALDRDAADDWRRTDAELAASTQTREGARRALRAKLDAAVSLLDPKDAGGSAGALPKLPPAALTLAWGSTPAGDVVFCVRGDEIATHRVLSEAPAAEALPAALAACPEALSGATEVRLLADPAVEALDVHAASVGGRPLIAGRAVTYAVDVAPRPRPTEPGPTALVVADARGDLPAARAEGERVTARLRALGFATVDGLVDRAATVEAVVGGLGRVGFLHVAGHGQFGGDEGWESNLPVADGRRVGVADLLSQGSLPARVVLSGCEMARSGGLGSVSGLGLAQAFVLGGAGEVVAATRPVRDADAGVVMDALYAHLDAGSGGALAPALARAQADLAAAGSPVDWAAFRVVVP